MGKGAAEPGGGGEQRADEVGPLDRLGLLDPPVHAVRRPVGAHPVGEDHLRRRFASTYQSGRCRFSKRRTKRHLESSPRWTKILWRKLSSDAPGNMASSSRMGKMPLFSSDLSSMSVEAS